MPKYEVLSDFFRDYTSLQPYDIPSPSYSVNELMRYSNVDMYSKKETYDVDLCHKEFEHVCQPLDEGHIMHDILCCHVPNTPTDEEDATHGFNHPG